MLHAKCYVLHVTYDMLCTSFIIFGKQGTKSFARDFFVVSRPTPRRSEPGEQPPILVWSRSGQGQDSQLGQRLAYTTVRSEQQGGLNTLQLGRGGWYWQASVEQNHKGSPRTAVGHSSEKSPRIWCAVPFFHVHCHDEILSWLGWLENNDL